jgi:hypothetical protein
MGVWGHNSGLRVERAAPPVALGERGAGLEWAARRGRVAVGSGELDVGCWMLEVRC